MKASKTTIFAALAVIGTTAIAPSIAMADNKQKQKNDWRNLAVGAGAIAGYGVLKGNSTATILGGAGAAYSAKRYEDERKAQSKENAAKSRYHRVYSDRKYYTYNGHSYYMNRSTGERVLVR